VTIEGETRTLDVDKSRIAFGEPLIDTALWSSAKPCTIVSSPLTAGSSRGRVHGDRRAAGPHRTDRDAKPLLQLRLRDRTEACPIADDRPDVGSASLLSGTRSMTCPEGGQPCRRTEDRQEYDDDRPSDARNVREGLRSDESHDRDDEQSGAEDR
jgi:hypothetical protein